MTPEEQFEKKQAELKAWREAKAKAKEKEKEKAAETKPREPIDIKEYKERAEARDLYSDVGSAFKREMLSERVSGDSDPTDLDFIQAALTPYSAKTWVGDYDVVKGGTRSAFGVGKEMEPSKYPLNVAASFAPDAPLADAFRPQTIQGPVSEERNKKLPSPSTRAYELIPETGYKAAIEGKTKEEAVKIKERFDAQRAMAEELFKQAPDATNEAVMKVMRSELDDMEGMLSGTSKRRPFTTLDPGRTSTNTADEIYGRGSTSASVPDPTPAQAAYLNEYYKSSSKRRTDDIKKRIADEDVPVFETMNIAGEPKQVQKGTRKRTPEEVTKEYERVMKGGAATDAPAWLDEEKRKEMLSDKTGEYIGWWSGTKYKSGATQEGWGAHKLRMLTSPLNIVSTALGSGAISAGAALGELTSGKTNDVEIKRVQAEAREKRGGKAAQLPEGFIGDLADSVMFGKGAEALVQENFKELGLSENLGWGLGFGLSLIAPPVGGVPTAAVRARGAFQAEKAIQAAGLLSKTTPTKAAVSAAASAMRDAWTWRDIGKAAIVPGSAKILAAEDTSKALMLRDELIKGGGKPEDIADIVNNFVKENGPSSLSDDLLKAQKAGDDEFVDMLIDVTRKVDDIPQKGSYFSGSSKLIKRAEDLAEAINKGSFTPEQGALFSTVIRNAVSRSDVLMDVAKQTTKWKGVNKTLNSFNKADPGAVKRAVNAVTAFDAFNQSTKALGWGEFTDLVLVTPRFVSTPDVALNLADEASKTQLGALLKAVTDKVKEGEVTPIQLTKQGQRVTLDAESAATLTKFVNGFVSGKLLNEKTGTFIKSMLKNNTILLYDLRRLQDLNIELLIRKQGKGIDTSTVRARARARAVMPKGEGWFAGQNIATQIIAKEGIFTPSLMRSALDGISTRFQMFRNGTNSIQLQRLDLPPESDDIIKHFAEKLSNIYGDLTQLMKDLHGPNPVLRKQYKLPTTGKVTPADVFQAIIRKERTGFVKSLGTILTSEKKSVGVFADIFKKTVWSDTNSLTDAGKQQLEALIEKATKDIETTDVMEVVKNFVKGVHELKGEDSFWLYPTEKEKIFKNMPRISPDNENEVAKLMGAALIKSMADNIVDDMKWKLVYDEMTGFRHLYDVSRGLKRQILKGLTPADAAEAQKIKEMSKHQVAAKTLLSILDKRIKGEDVTGIYDDTKEFILMADHIMRKMKLNVSDVNTVVDDLRKTANGFVEKNPAYLSRGKEIDDIITEIVTSNSYKPILDALSSNIPKDTPAGQRALEVLMNVFKWVNSLRYDFMLYFRPGYHTQNILSAYPQMHATIGGENLPSQIDMAISYRAMSDKGNSVAFVNKLGKAYTYRDLYELGVGSGKFKTEQQVLFGENAVNAAIKKAEMIHAPPEVGAWLKNKGRNAYNFPANFANGADNWFRTGALVKALRDGKPIDVAQTIGRRSLLDYGSLTQAEKEVSSRFLIFYTFQRLMAEEVIKSIASPEKAARFAKQMMATKSINDKIWEMSGGDKYDVSRFDGFGLKTEWVTEDDKDEKDKKKRQLPSLSPSSLSPSGDSFMMMAKMLHQESPFDVVFDTETGAAKFLLPEVKMLIPEDETRRDRLRLMDPNHVRLWTLMPDFFEHWLGELKPLLPDETYETKTYDGMEWQMTPQGYARYKEIKKAANQMGVTSTVGAWAPVLTNVNDPIQSGKWGTALKLFGAPQTQIITPQQQEMAVLEEQLKELRAMKKQREEQREREIRKRVLDKQ